MTGAHRAPWQLAEVTSPRLAHPVPVVVAREIPYLPDANRLQNLSIYLPRTPETAQLVGSAAVALPNPDSRSALPCYQVHIHGGAWRDPDLTSRSIEPGVAHAFSAADGPAPVIAIASINYSISASSAPTSDPARQARHPQHVSDVLHGLALLRSFGLTDRSYILSGHSCGACIALQAILQSPLHYGLTDLSDAPCPAAILGLNGLYDLPALTDGLGASHDRLRDDYRMLLPAAFGADDGTWPAASPAGFDPVDIAERVRNGTAPHLVVLDQSSEDQLVPMNQRERLAATLDKVDGLRVVEGHRCTGTHAAPWEQGVTVVEGIQDILAILRDKH